MCHRTKVAEWRFFMSDLRIQKTYSSLKTAFLTLLEQYRFEDITVQQLCDCANIRRATFYLHFADKYEFLSFFIQEMRKELAENISVLEDTGETANYYDLLFHELVLFFEKHPQLVAKIKSSQMLPTLMGIFAEEIQKNVYQYLQKQKDDSKNNEMKAHFYTGGILQLLLLWMRKPGEFEIDKINWFQYLNASDSTS